LADELMLDEEQILHLMKIYSKKMYESLDELKEAIASREYKVIGHLAHSIKGSSSNFRIEKIVEMAYELEKASYAKASDFDFESVYDAIVEAFNKIDLSE
jgi:HPt (histidine-containing phosphotransfer) domain-containing protein